MTGHSEDGDSRTDVCPTDRIFHPAEMAHLACFLLSDEASRISGETIQGDIAETSECNRVAIGKT